ncbi:aminotransferase class I/II-fold pyridoxal phosphate-dependent enzyme [Streptomyces axinellae]|uniref:Aminotransferase class I/II-fold pyridoxal phosphate-dependent enzyme n=1 Tax=Streptomyces axinellae TaxID=552788 RepID=A0ABN3QI68_9ACTN
MRRTEQGPDAAVREAACGYWQRRGMPTEPAQVAVAPGVSLLLLAVLAAADGDGPFDADGRGAASGAAWGGRAGSVLLPHPCSAWYPPQARLLGHSARTVPVPAECGGVPDPFALLETVRRARDEGDEPRLLIVSVADDVTGTAAPPELLHEVVEAATDEGLLLVSDETWRDTTHDPHGTVIVSPAEMFAGERAEAIVVLTGLGPTLLPPGLHAGIARFPSTGRGRALGEGVGQVLSALHTEVPEPVGAAAAEALREPEPLLARRGAAARLHGAFAGALHRAVIAAGAVCRPPRLGRQLYADFDQLRPLLAARGIADAAGLEAELVRRLGPYAEGGHRFGEEPGELRVRLTTDVLTGALTDAGWARPAGHAAGVGRSEVPADLDPLELPGAGGALAKVQSVLADLTDGSPQ